MVTIPSLNKIIIYGLLGATALFFFKRANEVGFGPAIGEIGSGAQSIGSAIGSFGAGFKELGSGIGTGAAQLFNPLFTLRDLIFPPEAGNQPAPTAATNGQIPAETPPITTPAPAPAPAAPAPETVSIGQQLTTQQAQYLLTTNQIKPKFAVQLISAQQAGTGAIRGENLQLYVNKRTELVRVRPSTAVKLQQRGYL